VLYSAVGYILTKQELVKMLWWCQNNEKIFLQDEILQKIYQMINFQDKQIVKCFENTNSL
jgi:hypothetical protein